MERRVCLCGGWSRQDVREPHDEAADCEAREAGQNNQVNDAQSGGAFVDAPEHDDSEREDGHADHGGDQDAEGCDDRQRGGLSLGIDHAGYGLCGDSGDEPSECAREAYHDPERRGRWREHGDDLRAVDDCVDRRHATRCADVQHECESENESGDGADDESCKVIRLHGGECTRSREARAYDLPHTSGAKIPTTRSSDSSPSTGPHNSKFPEVELSTR